MLLAGMPSTSAMSRRLAKCPYPNEESLVADSQAKVYAVLGHGENEGLEVAFGCVYAQGRPYRLGVIDECSMRAMCSGGIALITLAGPVVAYTEGFGTPSESINRIVVRSLGNGRVLHRVPTGVRLHPSPGRRYIGSGLATSLVVKSNGSVAWIAENAELSIGEVTYYEVHEIDKAGSRILAAGSNINPFSLALPDSGRGAPPEVYWTQGGKPMSATLN